MATRFYLPSAGAAAVSPAFGSWNQTTGADRLKCVTTKIISTLTNKVQASADVVSNDLVRQYVSDPLAAVTVSGTVQGVIRSLEASSLHDLCAQCLIRIVSNDGGTFRGTLYNFDNAALSNEFPITTAANRGFPRGSVAAAKTLSAIAASANDRLVIEIGWREAISGEGANGTLRFGDSSGTDLAVNETGTLDNNPWIEFSQTLTFAGGTPVISDVEMARKRT
jgi:hypothetical protein